jgi:hypothetical protein
MMQRRIDGKNALQHIIGQEFCYVDPYIAGKTVHGGCVLQENDIRPTASGNTALNIGMWMNLNQSIHDQ